jgi:hypothetical protein
MQEEWTTKQEQPIAMQEDRTLIQEWISMQKGTNNNVRTFEQHKKT